MIKLRYLLLAAAALMMTACAIALNTPQPATALSVPKQFRDRQILVTLAGEREAEWDTLTDALMHDYSLQKSGAFPLKSLGIQCLVFLVPEQLDVAATVERLRNDPRVEHAQQNQTFSSLAHNYNDRYAALQHGANDMHIIDAHAVATGKGVNVAIIDTGFDVDHPDLQGRFVHTENFVDGGEKTFNSDRHGTAVAGIIGARANNHIGIYGVAPDARLLGYKSCWYPADTNGRARCSSWTLVKAIDKAILDRARVINLSLAGPGDVLIARLLNKAIAQNVIVVAAVDDTPSADIGFPASLPNVIAVMATPADKSKPLDKFSGHASIVAAPGDEILTTFPGDHYDFASGSSLAAAHVSGIAALLLSIDPTISPAGLRALLTQGHDASGSVNKEDTPHELNACLALSKLAHTKTCDIDL